MWRVGFYLGLNIEGVLVGKRGGVGYRFLETKSKIENSHLVNWNQ